MLGWGPAWTAATDCRAGLTYAPITPAATSVRGAPADQRPGCGEVVLGEARLKPGYNMRHEVHAEYDF